MAPEVLEVAAEQSAFAYKQIDVYATGLVLWELISRCRLNEGAYCSCYLTVEYNIDFLKAWLSMSTRYPMNANWAMGRDRRILWSWFPRNGDDRRSTRCISIIRYTVACYCSFFVFPFIKSFADFICDFRIETHLETCKYMIFWFVAYCRLL